MYFLLRFMLIGVAAGEIVDMNRQCKHPVESFLDCGDIDAVNFQYSGSQENVITRINFFRLRGNVELKNLKFVNTVTVQRGEAKCDQLKEFTDTVSIQLSDTTIVCNVSILRIKIPPPLTISPL